jgi:hypothetical protein
MPLDRHGDRFDEASVVPQNSSPGLVPRDGTGDHPDTAIHPPEATPPGGPGLDLNPGNPFRLGHVYRETRYIVFSC